MGYCGLSCAEFPTLPYRIDIVPGNKSFSVEAGETVLDAARRAGLALPYSCLGGVCGSCKASLISGSCDYPKQPPQALTAAERAHGDVLLCQAVPACDLVISAREVPSVAELPRRILPAKVIEKSLLAEDVMRIVLQTPTSQPLRWLAGQYIDVLLAEGKRRAFSIANAPHQGDHIELHVRRVPGGGFTQTLFDATPVGTLWRIEGPLGTFVPREDSERPIIFMAGGTGFAPVKALIEHFLHLGSTRPMQLYWGARRQSDLYMADLPQSWQRLHSGFRFDAVLSEPDPGTQGVWRAGQVHLAVLDDHADLGGYDLYMSGPPAMIEVARHRFVERGLPEHRLHYDSFEYAPDVIAAILAARAGLRAGP
jgi:CDP-4-dehydro-6-deoxyglucose reductase, E3